MSSFEVALQRFVEGDFPMVCARSGAPATQMIEVRPERAPSKRTRIVSWLPGRGLDFASQALDSITRPTGKLPYTSAYTADTIPVLHTPENDTVRLVGVHPAFIKACEERWADTPASNSAASTAPPKGPVEQISLGSDPERAGALVDELRSRGFKVGYTPGPGMQRIVVRASDLGRVSATLASIDPDRFGR